ncbi:unknown [Fusobacterium nucleatum subsp. nucleatum ATCC 25586]|uniref:Uncharacterized protein n=1 Tax=Fusobacterium nucleatum subsp. nucleatum (strain ATCC 25586 / DSM 15643 / BCRC 10681 / CIP 101130 / JCM 8532 / KCTC 2640 / LMG 13131 / VPI 4355) TaxID=190304 RepID=Q8RED3_FUSNN|nr:unknown [Fusobacterium nucleatum subsp. nucleatum ATCC 25586]
MEQQNKANKRYRANLCISILEFKFFSLFFKFSCSIYLCISILEFKYTTTGNSKASDKIYVFLY